MRTILLIALVISLAVGAYFLQRWGGGRPEPETPAETDATKWRDLLQQISDLAIADPQIRPELTEEQVAKRWLGELPATESQIAQAEKRLGVRLPPSYRAFLKVSNGWNYPNSFVVRLASTEQIGWTRQVTPDMVEGFEKGKELARQQFGSVSLEPDDDLSDTLMISVPDEKDDAAFFMLNPRKIAENEMQAWFFSHWNPGATEYPSFWHLMVGERNSLRYLAKKSR